MMDRFEGHNAKDSLTSLLTMAKNPNPIELIHRGKESGSDDQEDWPEYLKMQRTGGVNANIHYNSGQYGIIKLQLLADTSKESTHRMAHYQWDAGLLMSQMIARTKQHGFDSRWSVKGKRVLELGAGTALVSIICASAGAQRLLASDYPDEKILKSISHNLATAFIGCQCQSSIDVAGHRWGEVGDQMSVNNSHAFNRVIATGCLWLSDQHENLARSLAHFLAKEQEAEVWLISGFFLGRAGLSGFFDIARKQGLQAKEVFEQDAVGNRRPWKRSVENEDQAELVAQGWLMVAVLGFRRDYACEGGAV